MTGRSESERRSIENLTRQLLTERHSLRYIAGVVNRSHTWVANFAVRNNIPRNPTCRLQKNTREEIKRELLLGMPLHVVALRQKVSKSTVHFYSRQLNRSPDEISFNRVRSTKFCPVHGAVTVWPCVACAASGALPTNVTRNRIPKKFRETRNRCG